jgi:methylmalonyl-CoA mutase cobalamin-binding subunit
VSLRKTDSASSTELLSITEVERQTGIRPATLRMWEKRYGFPQPLRDRHGDRVYPLNQVERLRAARHLIDQGIRPGKIFSGGAGFDEVGAAAPPATADAMAGQYGPLLDLLRAYRLNELYSHFQYRLLELGLRRFVIEFLAPLTTTVGLAWRRGELPVRCEHLFTQLVMSILHAKQAAVRSAGNGRPRVLLATLTGEAHALGIMMVEAVLATLEVECIQLGTDVPPLEVAAAARDTGAQIVALSFSTYFPRKSATHTIRSLRATLPPATVLWVGGDGAPDAVQFEAGVCVLQSLAEIEPALPAWRSHRAENNT